MNTDVPVQGLARMHGSLLSLCMGGRIASRYRFGNQHMRWWQGGTASIMWTVMPSCRLLRTGTSGTHGSSTAVNEVHTPTAGLLPKHACDLLVLNAWCAASLHECMTQAHSDHQGMALVWNTWAAERATRQIHIKCIRRPQTGMHGSEICLGETLLGKVNR